MMCGINSQVHNSNIKKCYFYTIQFEINRKGCLLLGVYIYSSGGRFSAETMVTLSWPVLHSISPAQPHLGRVIIGRCLV